MKSQIAGAVVLDGDRVRGVWLRGFEREDRLGHLQFITTLGKFLESEGHVVIVSVVSPIRSERLMFQGQFEECLEICLPFGEMWEGTEYEEPIVD